MATLRDPKAEATWSGEGNGTLPGPHFSIQNAGSTIQETQYNTKHAGIKRYENTRMQNERNAEDTGYRIEEMLRSLVAPLPRGRRSYRSPMYDKGLVCILLFAPYALSLRFSGLK